MSPNGNHSEAEGVEEVGAFLRRWRDPAPNPAAKAEVIALLDAELRAQHAAPQRSLGWIGLLLRSQVRLVHPATWAASALVIALGALVTLILYPPDQAGAALPPALPTALPLALAAPLVAACGVAFLYGLDADPALELQRATPISTRMILLARLTLLFGFNLTITLVCSVGLVLLQTNLSLMPLIAAWLAPMTFLSALSFLLSVLFFDSLASVLISLLIWTALTLRHVANAGALALYLPDVLEINLRPLLWIAAVGLVVVGLWIAEREERWTGGMR